jgi:hypothetical protein
VKILSLLLILVSAALVAAGPEQPLPFSHKFHIGTQHMDCLDCHNYPQKFGASMGFPQPSLCMGCHGFIAREKPAIQKLAQYAASKQPIPWVRVFKLPDFVFFDHRYHLLNEAQCADCHGAIEQQDVTTDELHATKMTFCQPCHVKSKAATGCNTCHNTQ